MITDLEPGPFVGKITASREGVVKQVLTTYRIRDGMFVIEIAERKFSHNGADYIDSSSVEPLVLKG